MPKVCQSTMSAFAMRSDGLASIHAGRPAEGSPEVWGTWRPAGWIWSSESGELLRQDDGLQAKEGRTLCNVDGVASKAGALPYQPVLSR